MKTFKEYIINLQEETIILSADEVKAAWLKVMPNSECSPRIVMGSTYYKFYLSKDKSETSNNIRENDPLSYSGHVDKDGTWKDDGAQIYVKPPEGSNLVYSREKIRAKSIKGVTPEKLVKRFQEVRKLFTDNIPNLKNIHFDPKTK